ncbi:helix-turn-helix transcriptional regulator [Angustibacter aerolatus]
MEISPTARALRMLEALQDSPGVTAERLARRLGTSERAVRRYATLLREAGIPVESTSGRYGGYRLGRGTRLPPVLLSAAEALGLVMAVLEGRPNAGQGDVTGDPVASAIAKLVRLLPAQVAESVTAIRQVTTANAGDAAVPPPDPHVTAALVQASDAGRRVRVTYLLPEPREMDVDPWAVSVRRGRWYLLCWSHTRDAQRVLRVDRVRDVRVLDERFERPAGLDPVAAVEAHLSTGWRYEVEVLVDAPLADVERWVPRNLGRLEAVSPRRTRLTGTTDEPRWYAWHLVGLDAPYRIVSPPELREEARTLGRRLTRAATEPRTARPGPTP